MQQPNHISCIKFTPGLDYTHTNTKIGLFLRIKIFFRDLREMNLKDTHGVNKQLTIT